ncbi:MAG TPA: hypothetical protein VFB84_16250 [Micromonosporaceae bacterium]|nr:hypothetical protein [Micromonosporaceae bacterium]
MNAEAMLDAGAVLPTGAPVTKDDTVDTLTARAYRHPALDGRVVVRLVPATLGEAEDLSLEFLAFGAPERVDEVGLVRQQALGFPAWALVHDPANGHHALALVKDIERLARTAKSRVGPANEGFTALGDRLARSVPHFLPTFYEEAGRAFLAADSPSYAAMMFGKARDAERSFGLAIDEERAHAVFLEFALAGALTAKALSAHSRDLAARCDPATAYERFRRLCVERTLGGLPPYAGMHTDLRRLAKAAGLDPAEADGAVLGDLLAAPAVLRAPAAFWTAYQSSLVKRAAADPVLRGRLLGLFPESCADDVWLSVLDSSGASGALTGPAGSVPAEAECADGPAGWLTRFAAHREDRSWRDTKRLPALLRLVERMAERLVADGRPVVLCGEHDDVDLDLLDACLATGVPVADPDSSARLPIAHWLADETDGRRDLVAIADDERFQALFSTALEKSLGSAHDPARLAAVLAVPGLRRALHAWLDSVAACVVCQGLPTLGAQLDRLKLAASPAGFAVSPDAVRRAVEHDLGPVLGRTLRAGVLDEYGWPAWDETTARLAAEKSKDDDAKVVLVRQWPVLLAMRGDLVLAVGADGIEAEHRTQIPKGQRSWLWRLVLRHVDGELLVCWDKGPDRAGYWTNQPDDVFVVPDDAFSMYGGTSLPVPGGGRTFGGRPLRVGDRAEDVVGAVASDGTSYWVLASRDERQVWVEYDVATGRQGRVSLPRFFEDGAVDGEPLELDECWLLPALTAAEAGPLGQRDGLVGWRVRAVGEGGYAGTGIDGRSFALSAAGAGRTRPPGQLGAALRFPGSDTTYGVLWHHRWNSESVTLCAGDGFVIGRYDLGQPKQKFARGTRQLPPLMFWHHLRPRDPQGSAALRALTDERADALLAGAAGLDRAGVRALIARELPELAHPALVEGVAGVVRQAAKRAATLRELSTVLGGESIYPKSKKDRKPTATRPATAATDAALAGALKGFLPYCYDRGDSAVRLVEAAAAALTAPKPPTGKWAHGGTDTDWYELLGLLPAAMYLAGAPLTTPEHRAALLALLETYASSGLATPGGLLRKVTLASPKKVRLKAGSVVPVEHRRLLVTSWYGDSGAALEYAPDGQFGPIPDFSITAEVSMALPMEVPTLVRLVRENGPPQWRPELATECSQAAGVSHAEAVLLLAGLPAEVEAGTLGLSSYLLRAAREAWQGSGRVGDLLGLLLPDDPAALWTDGPRLDRLAAWRVERHGRRAPVPDELLETVHRAGITEPMSASELLHGIANPDTCRWLSTDGANGLDAGGAKRLDPDDGPDGGDVTAETVAVAVARALPWLAYHLPLDHPIRPNLPVVAERARQRLLDPKVRIDVGYLDEKKVDRLITALGGNPVTGPEWTKVGPVEIEATDDWRTVRVCPALLSGPDDPALAVVRTRLEDTEDQPLAALRLLLAGRLAETVAVPPAQAEPAQDEPAQDEAELAQAEPVQADGQFLHDPSRCLPSLVAEVAGELRLSADAATVYLQLLALPDPTDRNVARWTGWKPARLTAARKELAASDLLVEAKRSRAGRSLFLPGGWLALKTPHPPVERWKIPLLTLDEDGSPTLGVVVPVAPLPRLFELAWQRVAGGDTPRFDELNTTERRR